MSSSPFFIWHFLIYRGCQGLGGLLLWMMDSFNSASGLWMNIDKTCVLFSTFVVMAIVLLFRCDLELWRFLTSTGI